MYYVYVLERVTDQVWYIGFSTDLRRRVSNHNKGKGGRTTRLRGEQWALVYYEAYKDKRDALGREKFLKSGSGRRYLNKQLHHYVENQRSQ